jgi:hypothetical protein
LIRSIWFQNADSLAFASDAEEQDGWISPFPSLPVWFYRPNWNLCIAIIPKSLDVSHFSPRSLFWPHFDQPIFRYHFLNAFWSPLNQKVGAGWSISQFWVIHHGFPRNSGNIGVLNCALYPDQKDDQKLRWDLMRCHAITLPILTLWK